MPSQEVGTQNETMLQFDSFPPPANQFDIIEIAMKDIFAP